MSEEVWSMNTDGVYITCLVDGNDFIYRITTNGFDFLDFTQKQMDALQMMLRNEWEWEDDE